MRILAAILTVAWMMPWLQGQGNDHRPIWLPEGRGIVFMSNRTGDWELYRMALDGSGLERLTRHVGWDGYADVSPDGRWIVFERQDDRDGKRLIRLDMDSREERELVRFSREGGGARWSPDGKRLAFWEDAGDGRDIYIVDADGARRTRVTRTPEPEHDPVFSRDGTRLTVAVNLASGTAIDDMALDGADRRRLLTVAGRLYGLSWSPDGATLAFNAEAGGHQRLNVMNADGTNRRRLSGDNDIDHLPVWSNDGKTLIFTTERGDRELIQLLDVATGRRRDRDTSGRSLPKQPIVFEGVNVVPMDRETVLEDMTVVVEDGRITALGRRGRVAIPAESQRIDARGRFLLPGLCEMHVHLRERTNVGRYLAQGFTTVRDMNGRLGDTLAWRDEVLDGTLKGPRIVAAGVTLYDNAPDDHPHPVRTPDEARRAVRDMAARGYDLIKVYRVRREAFRALMDEARKRSIPVAGHHPDVVHDQHYDAPLDLTMDDVLASGMVSLEHLDELIAAALRMKLDRDAIVPLAKTLRAHRVAVTTLLGQDFMVQQIRREGMAYLTDERAREIRAFAGEAGIATARQQIERIGNELPRHIQDLGAAIPDFSLLMLRTFHAEGVELLIGTDSDGLLLPAGRSGLDEMDLFIQAGLKPYDALRAATVNAATVLGRLDRSGTVAVGKEADLLLVDQNPLENLASLRRPLGVMVLGRFYDRAELQALRREP